MIFHDSNHCSFSYRGGNCIQLLVDGRQFYPKIINAIQNAQKLILMEMYLFESGEISDQFIHEFTSASLRGVSVQLLIDAYGCRALSKADRKKLQNAGVEFVLYNPLYFSKFKKNLLRTHRKYLVIDGHTAFIGGAGITDKFAGKDAWRETVVEIHGAVVQDWYQLFVDSFKHWSDNLVPESVFIEEKKEKYGVRARVAYTNGGTDLEIKTVLLKRMNESKDSVWLASAYFVPSRKIRQALRRAAFNGKDVRLLLPGEITDHPAVRYASRRYYARLLRFGVRIFEYQGRFTHTKLLLVDDWFSIGSSNMDRWNFRWNHEANQEIDDKDAAEQAREIMRDDFNKCREIIYHEWANRSRMQRLKEWGWGKVDLWTSLF